MLENKLHSTSTEYTEYARENREIYFPTKLYSSRSKASLIKLSVYKLLFLVSYTVLSRKVQAYAESLKICLTSEFHHCAIYSGDTERSYFTMGTYTWIAPLLVVGQ